MLHFVLELLEKSNRIYRAIVWIYGLLPERVKIILLRFVNPSVTLGALAVIIDPYSTITNPRVLLGWHNYHSRQGTPWALLGGALKKRDQEDANSTQASIPIQAVVREVREETGLDIEVVKLLAIDTDWTRRTMDFYFECALRHGYPNTEATYGPEVKHIDWFHITGLPDDMFLPHKRFLTDVLMDVPRLPGVSWTANQRPPNWWERLSKAEQIRRDLLNSTDDPELALATLVHVAQQIINCEIVSLFLTDPPIQIIKPDLNLPNDIIGNLRLQTESHVLRGMILNPDHLELPLSQTKGKKLGLTAWLVRTPPFGHTIRLHEEWLHHHDHAKNYRGHEHLDDRVCHSLAAVAIIGRNRVLGLLKAENKMRSQPRSTSDKFMPFGPDDGYILEELAVAAVPLLERLIDVS